MSYAVRKDMLGWRAVSSKKDVQKDEFYSEVEPASPVMKERKTREQVEVDRLYAYAHPVTGCDRFKAEADAERLQGNEEKAIEVEKKLLARRAEIAAENPWPIED